MRVCGQEEEEKEEGIRRWELDWKKKVAFSAPVCCPGVAMATACLFARPLLSAVKGQQRKQVCATLFFLLPSTLTVRNWKSWWQHFELKRVGRRWWAERGSTLRPSFGDGRVQRRSLGKETSGSGGCFFAVVVNPVKHMQVILPSGSITQ